MARLRHIGVLAAFLLAVGQIGVYGAGARSSSASAAAARMAPSTRDSSARRLPRVKSLMSGVKLSASRTSGVKRVKDSGEARWRP
jgi:hypothetical protein